LSFRGDLSHQEDAVVFTFLIRVDAVVKREYCEPSPAKECVVVPKTSISENKNNLSWVLIIVDAWEPFEVFLITLFITLCKSAGIVVNIVLFNFERSSHSPQPPLFVADAFIWL